MSTRALPDSCPGRLAMMIALTFGKSTNSSTMTGPMEWMTTINSPVPLPHFLETWLINLLPYFCGQRSFLSPATASLWIYPSPPSAFVKTMHRSASIACFSRPFDHLVPPYESTTTESLSYAFWMAWRGEIKYGNSTAPEPQPEANVPVLHPRSSHQLMPF